MPKINPSSLGHDQACNELSQRECLQSEAKNQKMKPKRCSTNMPLAQESALKNMSVLQMNLALQYIVNLGAQMEAPHQCGTTNLHDKTMGRPKVYNMTFSEGKSCVKYAHDFPNTNIMTH